MVSKKKIVTRILKKHQEGGRNLPNGWYYNGYVSCECGWEAIGETHEQFDNLMADHIYSKITKDLKKRKKISLLLKE